MRHEEADVSPVTIERSDALDAIAGLMLMARRTRQDARRWPGPNLAPYRRSLREAAKVYEAAARRIQEAADDR